MKYFTKDKLYITEEDYCKLHEIKSDMVKLKYKSKCLAERSIQETDPIELDDLKYKSDRLIKLVNVLGVEFDSLFNRVISDTYQQKCKVTANDNSDKIDLL